MNTKENNKVKTVADFIEELKRVPQDLPIIIREANYGYGDEEHFDYIPKVWVDPLNQHAQILKD